MTLPEPYTRLWATLRTMPVGAHVALGLGVVVVLALVGLFVGGAVDYAASSRYASKQAADEKKRAELQTKIDAGERKLETLALKQAALEERARAQQALIARADAATREAGEAINREADRYDTDEEIERARDASASDTELLAGIRRRLADAAREATVRRRPTAHK